MDLTEWYELQKYIYAEQEMQVLNEQYQERREEILYSGYPQLDLALGHIGYCHRSTETLGIELASLSSNYEKQKVRIQRNMNYYQQAIEGLGAEQQHLFNKLMKDNHLIFSKNGLGEQIREVVRTIANDIQHIKEREQGNEQTREERVVV
ncbi:hypothetical protein [Virgibacillus dokdonensis]|uniref:hypothetical protein n=1 Tax=Virgibacillus dokdonensis TaxID=302167 RepID=UPI000989C15C|nr:hypothetical protein [Virgibacillus dokdonensis]